MKLEFVKQHNLNKLMNELLAIIELSPINDTAVFTLQGDGENIVLNIPDDLSINVLNNINSIIQIHDSTPIPETPEPSEIDILKQKIELLENGIAELSIYIANMSL